MLIKYTSQHYVQLLLLCCVIWLADVNAPPCNFFFRQWLAAGYLRRYFISCDSSSVRNTEWQLTCFWRWIWQPRQDQIKYNKWRCIESVGVRFHTFFTLQLSSGERNEEFLLVLYQEKRNIFCGGRVCLSVSDLFSVPKTLKNFSPLHWKPSQNVIRQFRLSA